LYKINTFVNILWSLALFFIYKFFLVSREHSTDLNWGVISFVVIFPLVFAIGSSFTRREQAIDAVTKIKTTLYNITNNNFMYNFQNVKNSDKTTKHYKNLMNVNHGLIDLVKNTYC